jgi:arabinofuranosyltransferase
MQRRDDHLAPVVVLSLVAIAARIVVGMHITDDAYITMRYSRNLLAAGAMSYNPPDAVLGTSTPLWTWILALAGAIRLPIEAASVTIAAAADICSIALILTSPVARSAAAIVAAATIAAWPAYVVYAVSGMETSLYVLTVVAVVTALSRQRTVTAGVAASFGALCRPDGALLVLLGFGWTLLTRSRTAAVRFASAAALILAPWMAFALWRFGSPVPSSVIAKAAAAAADPWTLSFQSLYAYFGQGLYLPLTVLAVVGCFANTSASPFWRLYATWAFGYLAAMCALNAFTHFPWYFVPLLPVYTASAAMAIEHLAVRFDLFTSFMRLTGARTALAAVLGIVLLSRMPHLERYLVTNAEGREALYTSIASELALVDPGCTIAATEIGAIGYHYPGRVLDLVGLVSPEVLGRPVDDVLAESHARWLVTYDTHFDRAVVNGKPFSAMFERRFAFPVTVSRTLEVYERRDRSRCGPQ